MTGGFRINARGAHCVFMYMLVNSMKRFVVDLNLHHGHICLGPETPQRLINPFQPLFRNTGLNGEKSKSDEAIGKDKFAVKESLFALMNATRRSSTLSGFLITKYYKGSYFIFVSKNPVRFPNQQEHGTCMCSLTKLTSKMQEQTMNIV